MRIIPTSDVLPSTACLVVLLFRSPSSSSPLALSPLQKYFIRPKKKQVILEILKEINKKKDNVCSFFITHIYH